MPFVVAVLGRRTGPKVALPVVQWVTVSMVNDQFIGGIHKHSVQVDLVAPSAPVEALYGIQPIAGATPRESVSPTHDSFNIFYINQRVMSVRQL